MIKLKKVLVTTGGILSLLFGILHLSMEIGLSKMKSENSTLLQMLNIGLAVMLLSLGIVLLLNRNEIINTRLGKSLLFSLSLFYLTRLILGFVFPGGSLLFDGIILVCVLVYLVPVFIKTSD